MDAVNVKILHTEMSTRKQFSHFCDFLHPSAGWVEQLGKLKEAAAEVLLLLAESSSRPQVIKVLCGLMGRWLGPDLSPAPQLNRISAKARLRLKFEPSHPL